MGIASAPKWAGDTEFVTCRSGNPQSRMGNSMPVFHSFVSVLQLIKLKMTVQDPSATTFM
jgi:hypothetical protein